MSQAVLSVDLKRSNGALIEALRSHPASEHVAIHREYDSELLESSQAMSEHSGCEE